MLVMSAGISIEMINKITGVAGRVSYEGTTQLPKPRVFEMHYGAKERASIIIQKLYDFPCSILRRFFSYIKMGLHQVILGKSYNFRMMKVKFM
jgi:hypothetical protein